MILLTLRKNALPAIAIVLACLTNLLAQTTAFNYQGKLTDAGNPANGVYQMRFALFDAPAGGNQIGAPVENAAVPVAQGVFAVRLDFGATVFTGADRFLEIAVRRSAAENYTVLAAREQIASSPYAIRTLSAAQADVALDAQRLGGVDASEYVTNSTVGASFIRNGAALQTGGFNVSGNGFVGGNFGVGTTAPQTKLQVFGGGYGLTQTNGAVTVGTFLTSGSGWVGTRSNHPLNFFTNDGGAAMQIATTGEVGIGATPAPGLKLDVGGLGRFATPNGNINLGTPNSETGITFTNANRADIRFDAGGLKLLAAAGANVPAATSGILITTSGNVGVGTTAPTAKLQVESGGSFQTVLRVTNTGVGGNALLAEGDIFSTKNIRQEFTANGVVKAMIEVERNGAIARCYNGVTGATTNGCGFIVTLPLGGVGVYRIDFGFSVATRFFSITPRYATTCNVVPIQCRNAGANYAVNGAALDVFTFSADNAADTTEAAFIAIVY